MAATVADTGNTGAGDSMPLGVGGGAGQGEPGDSEKNEWAIQARKTVEKGE